MRKLGNLILLVLFLLAVIGLVVTFIEDTFGYNLEIPIDELTPNPTEPPIYIPLDTFGTIRSY